MNLSDASYRELFDYRINLIDSIYGYYSNEMTKENQDRLSEGMRNYLKEYNDVTYEIYRRDKELEEYVRMAKNDKSPYYFYVGFYEEMRKEVMDRYRYKVDE